MISVMKSKHSFARNLLLGFCFVCAVCIGTVAQGGASYLRSNQHFAPGRLVIDRVPNFGWNLGFNLQIDGRPVADIVQGHSYSTWLPAGPHILTVRKVPTVGYSEPTSTTVNIQSAFRLRIRRSPASTAGRTTSIRAAASDFEARRLLRQSARHRRERAPGTGPMLVPSLQWYQACPLSKRGIDLCTPDFRSRS